MNAALNLPILTEDVAQAIRRGDLDEVARLSPLLGCLVVFIHDQSLRDWQAPLIESLPHHAATFDLVDLRNLLVHLGYVTHESRATPGRPPEPRLLPALFVGDGGELLLLRQRNGDRFRWFDGNARAEGEGILPCSGRLFVFDQTQALAGAPERSGEPWFTRLTGRFGGLFLHLMAMTFWLNVTTIAVPIFIMAVYDQVIGIRALTSLPWLVGGIAFVLVLELCLRMLRAWTLGTLAGRVDYLLSTGTFRQLLHLSPVMTERSPLAAQLGKIRQFDNLRDFFAGGALVSLIELPALPIFFATLAWLGGWLAIIPVVAGACYALVAWLCIGRIRRGLRAAAVARTQREQMLMETFAGLRELKALSAEPLWRERFAAATAEQAEATRVTVMDQALLNGITNLVTALAAVAMLGFGTLAVLAGNLSVGALIASMTLMWRVQAPLQGLFVAAFRFDAISAAIRDVNQLMTLPVERRGRKSMLLAQEIKGHLSFDRVSFRYGADADPALLGVSFQVPARGFVAITGSNGAGKSTLLKLVNAMYPIASGTVAIDGIDTRQFDVADLRRLVSYVPQQPSLFRGTIAQNLRLRHPLATDDDLRRACFRAGILKAIEALPEGFRTQVGDHCTVRLPVSLIRGICIARALVVDSPILLLDEPASGLDNDGDEALMLALQAIKGHATILMVTHRPSHVRLADRVVVIERGMLKAVQTPDEYFAPKQPAVRREG